MLEQGQAHDLNIYSTHTHINSVSNMNLVRADFRDTRSEEKHMAAKTRYKQPK